jgi:hypothetical protein
LVLDDREKWAASLDLRSPWWSGGAATDSAVRSRLDSKYRPEKPVSGLLGPIDELIEIERRLQPPK